MFSKKTSQFSKKGFSIIEVVVCLAIITVGILGVLSLFTQTIRSGEVSINQEIATNLAQEGIEVIRNKRDSNWLKRDIDWNDKINETGYYKVNCKKTEENVKCEIENSSGIFEPLYLMENKIYTHKTDQPTIFKRKIAIDNTGEDVLKIISTVQWAERGSDYSVTMQDDLYNWQ